MDDGIFNNELEGQGGHHQVKAFNAQGGDAHEQPEAGGYEPGAEDAEEQGQPEMGDQESGGVSSHAPKSGVSQGEKTGKADEQIETQGRDQVDQDQVENVKIIFIPI